MAGCISSALSLGNSFDVGNEQIKICFEVFRTNSGAYSGSEYKKGGTQ
jgi:hypothetical protein